MTNTNLIKRLRENGTRPHFTSLYDQAADARAAAEAELERNRVLRAHLSDMERAVAYLLNDHGIQSALSH